MSIWITLKCLGCILVFTVCTMAGVNRGSKLSRRTVLLREMSRFLAAVRAELTYRKARSQIVLQNAEKSEEHRLLKLDFSGKETPPELVKREEDRAQLEWAALTTSEERRIFFDALRCVGMQDSAEQCEQLKGAQCLLEQAEKQAGEKAAEEMRIFRTLGVCAGCAAVLFLL